MRRISSPIALFLVAAAAGTTPLAQGQPSASPAKTVQFMAASLGTMQTFSILLPSTYDSTAARYPVVYLLHGLPQDHHAFSSRPWFAAQGDRGVIIVTPDAKDSWYVNSVNPPESRYEDFFIRDLIPYIDSHYRTIASRQGRGIAGISMGGWGAALLGLKHHQLFSAVGMFSAPFAISRLSMPESEMVEKTQQRFGPPNSDARRERDPNTLAQEVPGDLLPRLFVACGADDGFVTQSRRFVERLKTRNVAVAYREVAGAGHTFDVWDQEIPRFIGEFAAAK